MHLGEERLEGQLGQDESHQVYCRQGQARQQREPHKYLLIFIKGKADKAWRLDGRLTIQLAGIRGIVTGGVQSRQEESSKYKGRVLGAFQSRRKEESSKDKHER